MTTVLATLPAWARVRFPEVLVDRVVGPVTWRCLVSGMLSH